MFSIPTINTIGLCVLSWPSCLKRWSVDLEVWAIQVRAPIRNILFLFLFVPTNKIIFFRRDYRRLTFDSNNIVVLSITMYKIYSVKMCTTVINVKCKYANERAYNCSYYLSIVMFSRFFLSHHLRDIHKSNINAKS